MSSIELTNANLLVFSNKQDIPNAKSTEEIAEFFQLEKIDKGANGRREWYNQACCAINGQGLDDGLQWLSKKLKGKDKKKK